MAAGKFGMDNIEQTRKCTEEILTLMSDSGDIEAQRREMSSLKSRADKARDMERRQFNFYARLCSHVISCKTST